MSDEEIKKAVEYFEKKKMNHPLHVLIPIEMQESLEREANRESVDCSVIIRRKLIPPAPKEEEVLLRKVYELMRKRIEKEIKK